MDDFERKYIVREYAIVQAESEEYILAHTFEEQVSNG